MTATITMAKKEVRTNDSANKFKVEQMIGVGMAGWIYHVCDSISRRYGEQCIHWIENLT